MRRYYFPIMHKGETQADDVGELFCSAEVAIQYGARVAREIAGDPDCDRDADTVVIVVDAIGAEVARHRVASFLAGEVERCGERRPGGPH
ncbi:DUF6894 family protein [Bradyrhizobium canariense]